jgi:maltokinase
VNLTAKLLKEPLTAHVPRQRWFGGAEHRLTSLDVAHVEVIADGLTHVLVDTTLDGGNAATYQLVLGTRDPDTPVPDFLEGKVDAVVGEIEGCLVYDATVDPELALGLLGVVAPGEDVHRGRVLTAEQSNTSIVYDERLILKLFRRLADGPNPDAEVTRALVSVGFQNVPEPVAEWQEDGRDLAVVSNFLAGATDGFSLALTSLRDLFASGGKPEEAGGDFAPDARRLGIITAKLHLALAEAFGTSPGDAQAWADDMVTHLDRVELDPALAQAVRAFYDRLRGVRDPGPAVRVHGDYHLGQVLRSDPGWYVLDFEGEPDRPLEERRRPSSPMRDVAGMSRSFHYAAEVARKDWSHDDADATAALADAWRRHNTFAFVEGYLAADGVDAVVPSDDDDRQTVLAAFELDKAVYEVGYEQGHRPDWVGIPLAAVREIVGQQEVS